MSALSLSPSIVLLVPLLFYALVVYFIISVIVFMKRKTKLDQQQNEKLDHLIQLLQNRERQE
ncbi:hypothetical protein [Brevibacillus brevis]|uniref:DUF4083 domain-containing protein n=1 Tax=Brevibacillus brevis TaxID=1393 RepID=A0ABY9T000_BREBE|nr:hypothetical protein [Brevibacillus brevis]WNC13390.1 hypothetical protein RGB73_22220 [Brevibacillus brevis]